MKEDKPELKLKLTLDSAGFLNESLPAAATTKSKNLSSLMQTDSVFFGGGHEKKLNITAD